MGAKISQEEAQRRETRTTVTYASLMVVAFAVNGMTILELGTHIAMYHLNTPIGTTAVVGNCFKILILCYVIGDIFVLLTNKDHRDAVVKLTRNCQTYCNIENCS